AEPLSGRELEVLRLLAAGRSNQQIADELVITLATVKKHVGHILGKLAAGNRTQAVARARGLGLLRLRTRAGKVGGYGLLARRPSHPHVVHALANRTRPAMSAP